MAEKKVGERVWKKLISKKWFFLPAGLFALGIAGMVFFFVTLQKEAELKPNLVLPGEAVLALQEGSQNIYYEYVMAYSIQEEILFSFENLATGEVSQSVPPSAQMSYSTGGRKGELVAEVVLPETGEYRVSSSYTDEGTPLSFLIGPDRTFGMVFSSLSVIVGGPLCVIGLVLFVAIICLRAGGKRALAVPPQGGYSMPQAGPVPPQAPSGSFGTPQPPGGPAS